MKSSRFVSGALSAAFVATILFGLLNAQLELRRTWRTHHESRLVDTAFPSPNWVRLFALNYQTLAADVLWLYLIAQHGQYVAFRSAAADNLLDNGFVVARLDPGFYRLYEWTTGAFLNRRYPITDQDLQRVADLHDIGLKRFPSDVDLRVSAAMLFVGHGRFDSETRVKQSKRAAGYLEEAVALDPADTQLESILRFYRGRQATLSGESSAADEAAFWLHVLQTTSDHTLRDRATKKLREFDDSLGLEEQQRVLKEYGAEMEWAPFHLWAILKQQRR